MMRRGSRVPILEALLLTLEFMASKRSRTAGYVLELPNGERQVNKARQPLLLRNSRLFS